MTCSATALWGLFGHVVAAVLEHAASDISGDQTHRVEQADADAFVRAEGQHWHGQRAVGARPAVLQALGAEHVAVVGEGGAACSGGGVDPHIFVEIGWSDRRGPDRLGAEQPGQEFALAALEQQLGQVVKPVEGEMPGLQVGFRRGYAGSGRRGDAGQRRIEHGQPAHIARPLVRIRVARPGSKVVADDIDRAVFRQRQGFDHAVNLGGHRPHVVAGCGTVGVAHSAWVEGNDASPGGCEKWHHVAPDVPTLRPSGQQQDGCAAAALHEMQLYAGNGHSVTAELSPERRGVEERQRIRGGGGDDIVVHGKLLDAGRKLCRAPIGARFTRLVISSRRGRLA